MCFFSMVYRMCVHVSLAVLETASGITRSINQLKQSWNVDLQDGFPYVRSGRSDQFLNGIRKLLELVLIRMLLLVDQSCSVLSLSWLKSGNSESCDGRNVWVSHGLSIQTCQLQFFLDGQAEQVENNKYLNV